MAKAVLSPIFVFCLGFFSGVNAAGVVDLTKSPGWELAEFPEKVNPGQLHPEDFHPTENTNNPQINPENHHIWLRKTIQTTGEENVLYINMSRFTEIYIYQEKVFQFGPPENRSFPGWFSAIIAIPKNSRFVLSVYQYSPTANNGFHTLWKGNKSAIIEYRYRQEMIRFVIALYLTIFGIVVLFSSYFWGREKILLYLSGFSIAAGLYNLSIVHSLLQLWFHIPRIWPFIMYGGLFFLPVFTMAFLERLIGWGWKRITFYMVVWQIIYSVLALALSAIGVVHIEETLFPAQIFILLSILTQIPRVLWHMIKNRNRDLLLFVAGLGIFGVLGFGDILISIFSRTATHSVSQYGIIFFQMAMVFVIIRQYREMKDELKLNNTSLTKEIFLRNAELQETLSRIRDEMSSARLIQQKILPTKKMELHDIIIRSCYRPMYQIGGDLFDIHEVDENRIRVFLADATGHGMEAALLTMAIKTDYEEMKRKNLPIDRVMETMNRHFYENYLALNSFYTGVLLEIDRKTKVIRYISAGHPDQVLCTDGKIHLLRAKGPLVGIIPDAEYEIGASHFENNFSIFLLTDGLLEQMDSAKAVFGDDKLPAMINPEKIRHPDWISSITDEFQKFRGPVYQTDDITLIHIMNKSSGDG